jgi:N-acetylglutamate synthase/N-acetylornithine aminotransferase
MGTLNNRIMELAQTIFGEMGFDQAVYVENGTWDRSYMRRGKSPGRCKHIRVDQTAQSKNVVSVFCVVAQAHGLNAHWTQETQAPGAHEIVIHLQVAQGVKNTQALTDLPKSYTALAGFQGTTNGSLQLFGGQGFGTLDRDRVLSLLK